MINQTEMIFPEDRVMCLIGLPVSRNAKLLLVVLNQILISSEVNTNMNLHSGTGKFCCPPLPDLAELMGSSEHIARNAIKETEKAGFIHVERYPGHTHAISIEWDAITKIERKKFNVSKYL